MTSFAIIGHLAHTDADFSLNDLPGSGGRMESCNLVAEDNDAGTEGLRGGGEENSTSSA